MSNWVRLIICITIPLAVGGISGFATSTGISTWYPQLNKPSFNPPNYLFAPVWTALYLLMGISLYIITDKGFINKMVLIFAIQLALNFAWSFVFFYYHQPGWAFIEILLLWVSILFMIISFYRVNTWASLIQVPYLLWVSFASVLNFSIWILNR
ncbi:MAG: tryptophan-rich sensory protein [Cyclobacteriaceae bacterium]|nr:tryptophan-rich sensory protein [Cyclobacteriaceae bacterium]MDH4297488.1 tryptophan-rich sensory protein [Cyclobacteriaceae bacterium]MDH5249690.1 tryptophan-rich sensory protein [Cyclobacteriaceae bacterium]